MKLFLMGAAIKSKIEMLLKILSFHLQVKFFAIAAIGLLINIARFWMDIKKSYPPQKVRWNFKFIFYPFKNLQPSFYRSFITKMLNTSTTMTNTVMTVMAATGNVHSKSRLRALKNILYLLTATTGLGHNNISNMLKV